MAEVQLESTPVCAMIDTGSPVTIQHCQPDPVSDYKREVLRYRVQKAAPVDLLMNEVTPHVNLLPLQNREGNCEVVHTSAEGVRNAEAESTATVCLVHATRVPGRHFKVVRARVDASWGSSSLALFEPDNSLDAEGLSMAVELEAYETLTLLVENESCQPIWLQKGQVLGKLEPVCLVESFSELKAPDSMESNPEPRVMALLEAVRHWIHVTRSCYPSLGSITFQFQRKRGSS